MMKKKVEITVLAAAMTAAMGITSFAGSWQKDSTGWWWQNDDGGYPVSTWEWLDGNGDGVAESYYFDGRGYCLQNTITPDGYTVNADGAWVENGVVQTKNVGSSSAPETAGETTAPAAQYNDDYSGNYTVPYYEEDGSVTSQTFTITYNQAANTITVNYPRWGEVYTYAYGGLSYEAYLFFFVETEEMKDAIFFSAPGVIVWPAEGGNVYIPRS